MFLRRAGLAAVPLIVPAPVVKYFFAPAGGWRPQIETESGVIAVRKQLEAMMTVIDENIETVYNLPGYFLTAEVARHLTFNCQARLS